ncbi:MAG: glutamine-hydrolyzing carbamoyl-phosphate synthase small subunit [Candidatus Omnitrophota bacterium]
MRAILALEDGAIFEGVCFGASGERCGEVVFNTSMTGYQEILTDPSYKGQIVTMTYPLIGNYGVNLDDIESCKPFVEGFVVKECSSLASNWRSKETLEKYLKKNKVIGIEGVDTRTLTRHIRLAGAMKGCISTQDLNKHSLVKKAKNSPGLLGIDLVKEVTCDKPYLWQKSRSSQLDEKFKVVVLDCGVKFNILRNLERLGCRVSVMPASTRPEQILEEKPDGLVLSNGPGDPAAVTYVVETTKKLLGKLPIFGICLGHQMLGQALGAKTYKLKFGHHGANHPVKEIRTGSIAITAQNHGFCVDPEELKKCGAEITHINLYDGTCEGMAHKELKAFSVQYHPEAGPGPHDANYLFKEFINLLTVNSKL